MDGVVCDRSGSRLFDSLSGVYQEDWGMPCVGLSTILQESWVDGWCGMVWYVIGLGAGYSIPCRVSTRRIGECPVLVYQLFCRRVGWMDGVVCDRSGSRLFDSLSGVYQEDWGMPCVVLSTILQESWVDGWCGMFVASSM